MKITVEALKHALERKVWQFEYNGDYLRLKFYGEQTRAGTRHKWKGEFWDYMDERDYYSRLPRPVEIPEWVLQRAREIITEELPKQTIYIGWTNPDCVYKP